MTFYSRVAYGKIAAMKRGENLRKYYHTGPTYRTRPNEYRAWAGMLTRCRNRNFKDYLLYGGRGISVCAKWLSFESFYADMGVKPSRYHSLDRFPNGDGNYEPENCRWATAKEQARNWKHRNVLLHFNGESLTMPEWAERIGIARSSLRDRLSAGWSIAKAFNTPPIRQRERTAFGTFKKASLH